MTSSSSAESHFDDTSLPTEPPLEEPPFDDSYGGNRGSQGRSRRYSNGSNSNNNGGALAEYRQMPHDRRAEEGVLGAMLLSPNTVTDVIEILQPEDFYFPAHQLIYTAVLDLYSAGGDIDTVLVGGRLDKMGHLDRAGGAAYLLTLISSVPTAANARYYADIVAEKGILRRLVQAGTRVAQLGYENNEDAEIESVIDMAQQEVFAVAQRRSTEDYHVISDLLRDTVDELTAIQRDGGLERGVPTGFIDLDRLTNGLHAGQMIIIAARPGVGKSTLALDMMRAASIHNGKTSIIFSLEMSASEIVMRLLSAETEVKLSDMRSGRMQQHDWEKLTDKLADIQKAPLYIDDSPNMTMMEIRSKARRLKQAQGLDLIVLDYMQLMSSGKKVESRQQEVSEFSRQLKLLAKELEVPVIAISQLNRGPESRTDKKPQLADLRESGSLEQDADMVMLLYRPDSQDKDNERAGEADIIVAKHRGGPIDTVTVAHQLHYSRFVNMGHE